MGFGAGARPGTPRRRRTGLGEVAVPGGDIRGMRNVGGYSTVGFRTNPPIDRTRTEPSQEAEPSPEAAFERELAAIDRELAAAEQELAAERALSAREPAAAGAAAPAR